MFGPIVSIVGFPRPPVDAKLLLALAIAEPMKMHVHGFSSFQLDFTVDDGISHGVVSLEWSGRLSVACRMIRMYTASRAVMNSAASSASVAEAMTCFMM